MKKTNKTKTVSKPKAPVATVGKSKVKKTGLALADIKAKAKVLGVNPGKLKKADLILAIQKAEKNTPCFGTGTPACPHMICCWRIDCII